MRGREATGGGLPTGLPWLAAFLAAALWAPALRAAPSGAELAAAIRSSTLDPTECYRVRDLSLIQEDVKLYFNEGYLIFSKPVNGERLSAVFSADVEDGDAETVLIPPYRSERQSLARFTNSPNMDEHFRAAVLILSSGPAEALRNSILNQGRGRKAIEMGPVLAEQASPAFASVVTSFQLRLVQDLLTPPASRTTLLFAALAGRTLGNFDLLYDGRAREQVLVGQMNVRDGRAGYDVWASFPSRSSRANAAARPVPFFTTDRYKIDSTLDNSLRLKSAVRISIKSGPSPLRALGFEVSRLMHVSSAKVDGAPAELLSVESERDRALRDTDNDPFLVIAPAELAPNSAHEIEFEEDGAVIAPAGNDVYFVGARANWYPQAVRGFAIFDLTFKYPKRLTLVSAGDVMEDRIEGDWRTTRRVTPVPVRLAGFNLGDYLKIESATPGFRVEVYGNRALEAALQPKPQPPTPPRPTGRGRVISRPIPAATLAPDPAARLRAVAADVAAAVQFYSGLFAGPPNLRSLTVAPIPGTFGQGFPGLVYLSTLAYLNPDDRPAESRGPAEQVFYSDLIEAHEVAHQWWGNVVTSSAYQYEWMQEALASYSALLWLEKKKGAKAFEAVLDNYRDHLLNKDELGRTTESAGPIIWGLRLESSALPDAWRLITYEKGAWIFHMLRRRLGDERFMNMLAELRKRYEFKNVTTENLKDLAKEFLPSKTPPAVIDTFFENWVYATGIPTLKLKYSVKPAGASKTGGVRISGTIAESGVDDDFTAEVPVEIQFSRAAPQTLWVRTSSDGGTFSATLKQTPLRVVIPDSILAKR